MTFHTEQSPARKTRRQLSQLVM